MTMNESPRSFNTALQTNHPMGPPIFVLAMSSKPASPRAPCNRCHPTPPPGQASNDPFFSRRCAGPLSQPARAVVPSTQPPLPWGWATSVKRHGTTTLFAALDRHRHHHLASRHISSWPAAPPTSTRGRAWLDITTSTTPPTARDSRSAAGSPAPITHRINTRQSSTILFIYLERNTASVRSLPAWASQAGAK